MKKYTFDDIKNENLVLYRYVRGSHLYGLNNENSDIDTGGVFYEPIDHILGIGTEYSDEISDDKHDNVLYELQKFFKLLGTSNPTMLESLFIDKEHVIYEHPIITEIKKYNNKFLSKELYKPFVGYAESQIKKAVGLHKLCHNPITERKWPIDFCFTTYKQGTASMTEWLKKRGLYQEYCGLVSLNNMPDCYGVFYDWGAHNVAKYNGKFEEFIYDVNYCNFVANAEYGGIDSDIYEIVLSKWFEENQKPIGYRGIVKGDGTADDVRCSSIPKEVNPICTMSYNKDGFTQHCKKYHEYQEWLRKRNQARYEENKEKTWDGKNMMHCLRLLTMAQEVFEGKGVQLNRRLVGDADFFLKVRNHMFEYEEIREFLENKLNLVNMAYKTTDLPEKVDMDFVNGLLIDCRKKLYHLN